MTLAKIIPIRPERAHQPATCCECIHGYMGVNGVLCEITMQLVFDESCAANCEAYEKENFNG